MSASEAPPPRENVDLSEGEVSTETKKQIGGQSKSPTSDKLLSMGESSTTIEPVTAEVSDSMPSIRMKGEVTVREKECLVAEERGDDLADVLTPECDDELDYDELIETEPFDRSSGQQVTGRRGEGGGVGKWGEGREGDGKKGRGNRRGSGERGEGRGGEWGRKALW